MEEKGEIVEIAEKDQNGSPEKDENNRGNGDNGKNRISSKKIAGGAELAAALVLALLSGWLFYNTRGSRLLYVSVAAGRVSRYYEVFLAAAAIFLAIGLFTLKARSGAAGEKPAEEKTESAEKDRMTEGEL